MASMGSITYPAISHFASTHASKDQQGKHFVNHNASQIRLLSSLKGNSLKFDRGQGEFETTETCAIYLS